MKKSSPKRVFVFALAGGWAMGAAAQVTSRGQEQTEQPSTAAQRVAALPRSEPMTPRPIGSIPVARPGLVAPPTIDPMRTRLTAVSFYAVPQAEPRVLKQHDLVTVIVREQSEMTADAKTDLSKEYEFNAKLKEWIALELGNVAIKGGAQGANPPGIGLTADREFKADGSLDRKDSFSTRITAEVIDVKPNGNVVLQASKRIKHDEEEQSMILTGICRAEDITGDNTVLSTQLYDLNLEKKTKGAVTDTSKRGLIPRIVDKLNPF